MTGSIVVGYTATDAGADALALGARLAHSLDAQLDLVIVLPPEGTRSSAVVPPERAFEDHVRAQAEDWLRAAAAHVPADVRCIGHVRFNESFAEGIIAAGEEFDARLVVVGAANGTTLGRHRLGSVASELVHSSTIPVALAPAGSRRNADADMPISRVTVAVGTRAGADAVLEAGVGLATAARGTLRLVSLVPFDVPAGLDTGTISLVQNAHGEDVLTQVRAALPEGVAAEVERAAGDSVEDAVAHLRWHPGEVVMVGSSRLAQPRRLFLGSTAAKMLHELPVPMIVVPRARAGAEAGER